MAEVAQVAEGATPQDAARAATGRAGDVPETLARMLAARSAGPPPVDRRAVLALQRRAGNAAVGTLLGRRTGNRSAPVQREPDAGQQASIESRAQGVAEQARQAGTDRDPSEPPPAVDPAAKRQARAEQQGNFAQPDKVSGQAATVASAASGTHAAAATPAQPVGVKGASAPAAPDTGHATAAATAVADAHAHAQAAKVRVAALTPPAPPPPLTPPATVDPVDSTGAPLPISAVGDVSAAMVATRLAHLRHGAGMLGVDATTNRARSHALRGGLAGARGKIDEAAGSIGTVKGHVAFRRAAATQSGAALDSAKESAEKVASGAPGIAAKADDGQRSSGPMATESAGMAARSGAATPDDEEGAAKAREQGGQLNQVSGQLGSIDSAIGQSGTRARQLQAEAEHATATNATSAATIAATHASLDATDAKLDSLTAMNESARGQVDALVGAPDEIEAGAAAQEAHAQATIANSVQLEARMHAAQDTYRANLAAIPPVRRRGRAAAGGGLPVQRLDNTDSRGRFHIDALDQAAAAVTGDEVTPAEAARMAAEHEAQRQRELAEINELAGGDFSRLDEGQKAGIALRVTFDRTFGQLSSTNWPKFGLTLLRGFVDPRVSLGGILTGLNMILSGGANLFSAEQWARDPLGNLLKSAADIATGVTIVLGSIAGLAVAIIAISAAIILVTFGLASPVLLPVISFCSFIAATVGPWAVTAAEVALVLNALVFIKDLAQAAAATKAEDLQTNTEAMGEDVNTMGSMAMQIAGDKIGHAAGPLISDALEGVQGSLAGSGSAIGANLGDNMGAIGNAMADGAARAQAFSGSASAVPGGAGGDSAGAGGGPSVDTGGAPGGTPAADATPPATAGGSPTAGTDATPPPTAGGSPGSSADAAPPSTAGGSPGPTADGTSGATAGASPGTDAAPPTAGATPGADAVPAGGGGSPGTAGGPGTDATPPAATPGADATPAAGTPAADAGAAPDSTGPDVPRESPANDNNGLTPNTPANDVPDSQVHQQVMDATGTYGPGGPDAPQGGGGAGDRPVASVAGPGGDGAGGPGPSGPAPAGGGGSGPSGPVDTPGGGGQGGGGPGGPSPEDELNQLIADQAADDANMSSSRSSGSADALDHAESLPPDDDQVPVGDERDRIPELDSSDPKPTGKERMERGNDLNTARRGAYSYREVYLEDGTRVDGYTPDEAIVSRKSTQLAEISEATADGYVDELLTKYHDGMIVADVPSNRAQGAPVGQPMRGQLILEVDIQNAPIPEDVGTRARNQGVIIRDVTGTVLNEGPLHGRVK